MRLASIIPYVVQYTHLMNANYNIEEASVVANNDKNMVTTEEMTAQEELLPVWRAADCDYPWPCDFPVWSCADGFYGAELSRWQFLRCLQAD